MYRRFAVAAVVLAVVCSGAWIGLRIEHRAAKDRRDLHDLTRASPWPRKDLLVPDDLPRDGAMGWLDRNGLDVAFDLVIPGGRTVPVTWQLHRTEPDGTVVDGVNCLAVATVTCTDLGDGFTFAVSKHVHNSIPSTALLRSDHQHGRVVSVTVQTPEYVDADALRPVLIRTHRPTDAELLALLRYPGYRTDWSYAPPGAGSSPSPVLRTWGRAVLQLPWSGSASPVARRVAWPGAAVGQRQYADDSVLI